MAISPGAPAALSSSSPSSSSSSRSTGGGVSDKELEKRVKLQNFLVMKAFNMRKGKQTLAQQFQFLRRVSDSSSSSLSSSSSSSSLSGSSAVPRGYLELGPLCEYLSIPPFRRLVLCQIFHLGSDTSAATRLDFDAFLRFLQTAAVQAAHEEDHLQRQYSSSSLPAPPPAAKSSSSSSNNHNLHELVCFAPSLLSMRFARPPPAPGLWKKREITIQEKITEYTKIDEHGRAQHLVEKERHQSEVIHMESLSGEFAHREITQFEQLEQLNDDIVHHETGREEFVHLKSQHDEVSKFESSIPTGGGGANGGGRPEECEQPPPSPTIKRDPSAMDCGGARAMDCGGARAFQSPGGGGGEGDEEEGAGYYPQEGDEEAYCKYQQSQHGVEGAEEEEEEEEMARMMAEGDEYPLEHPPIHD